MLAFPSLCVSYTDVLGLIARLPEKHVPKYKIQLER